MYLLGGMVVVLGGLGITGLIKLYHYFCTPPPPPPPNEDNIHKQEHSPNGAQSGDDDDRDRDEGTGEAGATATQEDEAVKDESEVNSYTPGREGDIDGESATTTDQDDDIDGESATTSDQDDEITSDKGKMGRKANLKRQRRAQKDAEEKAKSKKPVQSDVANENRPILSENIPLGASNKADLNQPRAGGASSSSAPSSARNECSKENINPKILSGKTKKATKKLPRIQLLFKQPAEEWGRDTLLEKTGSRVKLETFTGTYNGACGMTEVIASVVVANVGFTKNVILRYTTDNWKTEVDIPLLYDGHRNERIDKFNLKENVKLDINQEMKFAICYSCDQFTEWDNNMNNNYTLKLVED